MNLGVTLFKLAFLSTWGLFTVGATLFLCLFFYLPQEMYVEAIAAFVAMIPMNGAWLALGAPALLRTFNECGNGVGPLTGRSSPSISFYAFNPFM